MLRVLKDSAALSWRAVSANSYRLLAPERRFVEERSQRLRIAAAPCGVRGLALQAQVAVVSTSRGQLATSLDASLRELLGGRKAGSARGEGRLVERASGGGASDMPP